VIAAACLAGRAFATTPAPPPIPGIELIRAGNCATFAKTIQNQDAYAVHGWFDALVALAPGQWLMCLDALPPALQTQLLLISAAEDERLLKAWRGRGGNLNAIRTADTNLMGVAASRGNLALMQWLRGENLRPLGSADQANELADAAGKLGVQPKPPTTAFDWLLSQGYAWPRNAAPAHRLLASLASSADDALLASALGRLREIGIQQRVLSYDADESFRPLIFHARSARAVQLMNEWQVNVHARQIDRDKGTVTFPSALFNHQLDAATLGALLDLGVSPKGRDSLGYSPLVFAIRSRPADLELMERYLKAGAEISDPRVDPIREAAALRKENIRPDQLRALLRLLLRYGAKPRIEKVDDGPMWSGGGLPIHVAIANGQTTLLSVWMEELQVPRDVRHPETGASLIAYALEQRHDNSDDELVGLVTELDRLGVSMRPLGESPVARAIADRKKPPSGLVRALVALGADINAMDDEIGMPALALVLKQMHYYDSCDTEPCWMTDSQSADLVRLMVQQGANPDLAGKSGESARTIADLWDDREMLEIFRARSRSGQH